MGHPLAQVRQDRAHPREVLGAAAGHDRQRARLGARRAAGHRGVQPAHAAARFQLGGHLAGRRRLQAGEVHQQLAGPGALGHALRAEHHLAHHRRIGQAQHHQVGGAAQLGRRRDLPGAGGHQRRAFVRAAVPHRQRIAGGEQATAHRQAHQADAGESERR
ncbi:hypothetical protein D9M69_416570 [compost metagenome]